MNISLQSLNDQMADLDTKLEKMTSIASDAVELLETSKIYNEWFSALAGSMGVYLKSEPVLESIRIETAGRLASLAKYLAEDMRSMLESQGDELAGQLAKAASSIEERRPSLRHVDAEEEAHR